MLQYRRFGKPDKRSPGRFPTLNLAGIMKRPERLRRIYWTGALLAFSALLVLAAVLFLNPTSVGNPQFVSNLTLWSAVWAIYFIVALTLLFIFARNLIKLFFEHQSRREGTRLKRKLVLTLTIISLFPALIYFFVATGLINENLKLWFSSPSEDLLEASEIIASNYYEEKKTVSMVAARTLSGRIDWAGFSFDSALRGRIAELGFDGLMLVDRDRKVRFRQGDWEDAPWDLALDHVLDGREYYGVSSQADLNLRRFVDRGLAAVPARGSDGSVVGGLVASFALPDSVKFRIGEMQDAAARHRQLMSSRQQFENSYFLIMTVTTLIVVVVFVWLGTYMARRITVPLEALAQGARELAEGNLDHRVEQKAVDELGILVDSFNRMADEIRQSRRRLEQANAELRETNERLDERRKYIEAILENIATGVVSVDGNDVIRTVNQAAMEMFGAGPEQILNRPLSSVLEPDVYADFEDMKKRVSLFSTDRRRVNFKRGQGQPPLTVTATTTNLPFKNGVEHLVVLDDLTELIRAEKFAAWQEVARRLAHEIKNPLTPIQLSADRIRNRFHRIEQTLPGARETRRFGETLTEATALITTEAATLKTLVEEFSRFARLPICHPVEVDPARLVEQTLARYDGALKSVGVRTHFDPRIKTVRWDPVQIQRVFVNLIDNSLDALVEVKGRRRIGIRSRYHPDRGSMVVEFEDNGTGISPEDYENLFLPYFSTKKRGTGLGLAIVRQIVSEHDGFIRAERNEPRGTRFIMEFPSA